MSSQLHQKHQTYFKDTTVYKVNTSSHSGIAVVTGARTGLGRAIAAQLASLACIDSVVAVSRRMTAQDCSYHPKIFPLAADITNAKDRAKIVATVEKLCGCGSRDPNTSAASDDRRRTQSKQLRYLVHNAATIEPLKPVLDITPEELRYVVSVNCEAPMLLSMALAPYLRPLLQPPDRPQKGRILHVGSGAAHKAPPIGWGCYGISKAALFQCARVLQNELDEVVVGSFQPGIMDTPMQRQVRASPSAESMLLPLGESFAGAKTEGENKSNTLSPSSLATSGSAASPPPKNKPDSPKNVAMFVEYLLTGTSDADFAIGLTNEEEGRKEHKIRDPKLFPRWILPENLP